MFYAIDRRINFKQIKYLILLGVIAIVILTIPAVQEKYQACWKEMQQVKI